MKEKAISLLKQIYESYSSNGIKAVYLYGSILRDDFNPKTGDIDSIAIVDDSTSMELEQKIRAELTAKMPEIKKFGLRLLYESELKGGEAKGFLASVISPKSLILDLPNWEHVAGKQFIQSDFVSTLPTYREAILSEVPELRRHVNEDDYEYLVKKLAQIVDLCQRERGKKGLFLYSNLEYFSRGFPIEEKVVEAILEIRKNNYNSEVIRKHKNSIQEFVNYIYALS